jgi:hypothetical protein
MSVWQGVATDSLKFHQSPPCPTLLHLAGGRPLKRPSGHFRDGSPTGWAAGGCLLPIWIPHAPTPMPMRNLAMRKGKEWLYVSNPRPGHSTLKTISEAGWNSKPINQIESLIKNDYLKICLSISLAQNRSPISYDSFSILVFFIKTCKRQELSVSDTKD